MKIALLSGAYRNAGDYLIEQRAKALFQYVYPDSEILLCLRNDIPDRLREINTCDAAVFAGGPIYMRNLDGYLPLDICMNEIQPPISILGGGWYGKGGGNHQSYGYHFNRKTTRFLKQIDERGGLLSVRDWITYEILRQHELRNVVMTGCPAWYDLAALAKMQPEKNSPVRKIVISDPASPVHYRYCLKLIQLIRQRYAEAKLVFAFHRGIPAGKAARRLLAGLEDLGVEITDLSGNADGFSIYNDCCLHIGYRVHAHIYNLSIRNRSLLIEEDGRGAGVNRALGLPGIQACNDLFQFSSPAAWKIYMRTPLSINRNLTAQTASCLDRLEETRDQYFRNAYALQAVYFEQMVSAIRQIGGEV